jgi:hypothetical protein
LEACSQGKNFQFNKGDHSWTVVDDYFPPLNAILTVARVKKKKENVFIPVPLPAMLYAAGCFWISTLASCIFLNKLRVRPNEHLPQKIWSSEVKRVFTPPKKFSSFSVMCINICMITSNAL